MADDLHLRRYRPDDCDAVWTVHERAFRASPLPFVEDAPIDEDLRRIRAAYLDAGGEFLVGEIDGEVVAIGGFLSIDDATVEIKRMRVDPDHQRNGYGAAVLAALEDAASRAGYERAVLETHELLAAAQALYESEGYRETGRESSRGGYERIRYEKEL